MDVLLMADVASLGTEGDVVKVSDGYARNFLFPKKLAAPVTAAQRRRLGSLQRKRELNRQAQLEAGQTLAAKMEGISCTIPVKVGKDEKLYGSVTTADIAAQLKSQGIEIDRHNILLPEPLKELGVFTVKIKIHPELESSIKVWVVEE